MLNTFLRGLLFDKAESSNGAGGTVAVDPGAPFILGEDDAEKPKEVAKPVKTDIEKRLEALEKDISSRDSRIKELEQSERYWHEQAKRPADEGDEEPAPAKRIPPVEDEKPEKFLDDLSVRGLKAMRERGVITQDQFEERLEALEQRFEQKLELQQKHNAIDAELGKFPELRDTNSDLFKRAQGHFRQMVSDDAAIKNSPAALLAAVRMAKKEIEMETASTSGNDRQNTRRERIERQMGDRSPAGHTEDGSAPDPLSPGARQIVSNLSRFGASEDGFRKFSNGRGK